MVAFSGLAGATCVAVRTTAATLPTARTVPPSADAMSPNVIRSAASPSPGRATISASAPAMRVDSLGAGLGIQISSAIRRVFAGSRITWPISSAVSPSTSEEWDFVKMAKRLFDNPSTRYISHSGRVLSSGRDLSRATRSCNWASDPGFGSADRRTWYSMSKSWSSTHTGRDSPSATSRTFCR